MIEGTVFNIERYAIHDGPGIRTTVFLKGCPLRCWWCHNPEGQPQKPELIYRKSRCIGCGICAENCPRGTISLSSGRIELNRDSCNVCGRCMAACPSEAISIVGKKMSVKQVVKEIERDLAFYEESGGGVTFSGGEPLLQVEFLNKLLDSCNMRGIHATLDTSGYVAPEIMDSIRSKVDLFLYDIKIIDDRKHRKYTGVSNKVILHNLEGLTKGGSNVAVSLPVIPHINDDEANITDTGKLISSLHYVKYVTLLSYHRTGLDKYQSLGRSYKLTAIRPPTTQKLKIIKKNLESFGLVVKIGGR